MTSFFARLGRRGISLLTAGMLALSLAGLPALAAASLPEPTDVFYVADYANVLENDTVEEIVSANKTLEEQTGAQIVVVTVDFLDGYEIEDYAYSLFNQWKIGDQSKNNGVLLLLTIGEENYWCVQGRGLEKSLSSDVIDDILWNNLETDFAAGNYDAGVRKTFEALYDTLAKQYGFSGGGTVTQTRPGGNANLQPAPSVPEESGSSFGVGITVIALVVIFALFMSWRSAFRRRGPTVVVTPPPIRPRPPIFRPNYYGRSWRAGGPIIPPPPRPPRPPRQNPPVGSWGNPAPRPTSRPTNSGSFGGGLFGGSSFGGGGSTRGGGAGRSSSASRPTSSSRSGSSFGGSSFGGSRGGSSFGGSRGGGGSSRGGGAGRRGR